MKTLFHIMNGETRSRADLPNQKGFKFVAMMNTGEEKLCEVTTNAEGAHIVQGATFTDIKSWKPIAKN